MKILGKQPSREKCAESGWFATDYLLDQPIDREFILSLKPLGSFVYLDMLKEPFFKIESDYYMIKGVQGKDYFRIAVHGKHAEELEKLVEIAKIQSTEASNAIEGIVTTSTRIRQLVEEKTAPKNRDEQEIAGYRDVLNIIHENFDAIPISQRYILQLHKILYSHMNNPMAGKTKSVQNYISATYPDGHVETLFTPLAPYETPEALDKICEEYNRVIGNMEVEPLIIVPIFIHDFLCIHPFNDGNGRMSRLLTTLLLYRNGFYVGKYISLEAKIAKNKDLYYNALGRSQDGWHEGMEDVVPFIKYLLGIVLSAYKDFEERFALVETKRSALEMVRCATMNKLGRFTKQDIRELCPSLSISSIEGALRKLVASGELKREGVGKNICYYRLK